jgi:hypothetical protein
MITEDQGKRNLVLTSRPDRCDSNIPASEFPHDRVLGFVCVQAAEVYRGSNFDLSILDPQKYLVIRLASN